MPNFSHMHDGFVNYRGRRKPWPKFSRLLTQCGEGCCCWVTSWEMSNYLWTFRAEPMLIFLHMHDGFVNYRGRRKQY